MRVLSLLLLAGCGAGITGEVTDIAGQPLEGATVTAVAGERCQGTVKATGAVKLRCDKVEHTMIVAMAGYISEEIQVDATAGTADFGTIQLIKVPASDGLFLFDGSDYASMEPGGVLVRHLEGNPRRVTGQRFCVDTEQSTVNRVDAGTVKWFDNRAPDWRAWKLDEEGCALRRTRQDDRMRDTWSEKVRYETEVVGERREVLTMELEPGGYFIADWENGDFKQTNRRDDDSGRRREYSGYYLVAE